MKKCTCCDFSTMEDSYEYCYRCGAKLTTVQIAPTSSFLPDGAVSVATAFKCEECGEKLDFFAKNCPKCGGNVAVLINSETQITPPVLTEREGKIKHCTNCNFSTNNLSYDRCPKCSYPLVTENGTANHIETPYIKPEKVEILPENAENTAKNEKLVVEKKPKIKAKKVKIKAESAEKANDDNVITEEIFAEAAQNAAENNQICENATELPSEIIEESINANNVENADILPTEETTAIGNEAAAKPKTRKPRKSNNVETADDNATMPPSDENETAEKDEK